MLKWVNLTSKNIIVDVMYKDPDMLLATSDEANVHYIVFTRRLLSQGDHWNFGGPLYWMPIECSNCPPLLLEEQEGQKEINCECRLKKNLRNQMYNRLFILTEN